ncbi:MAG: tetratricopeptide repeat protein [Pseudomonadota bacterium]
MHLRLLSGAFLLMILTSCADKPELQVQAPEPQPRAEPAQNTEGATFLRMGDQLLAKGAYQAASKMYKNAIDTDPSLATPYVRLGDIAWQTGRLNAAAELYRQALQRDQTNPDALLGRARALALADETDAAMLLVDDLLSSNGPSDRALSLKGMLLDLTGDHAAAQALYRPQLEKRPKDITLRTSLAYSSALAGDYRAAANTLRPLAQDPATTPTGQYTLADVYALSGQTAVALELRKAAGGGRSVSADEQEFLTRLARLAPAERSRALYFRVLPTLAKQSGSSMAAASDNTDPGSRVPVSPEDTMRMPREEPQTRQAAAASQPLTPQSDAPVTPVPQQSPEPPSESAPLKPLAAPDQPKLALAPPAPQQAAPKPSAPALSSTGEPLRYWVQMASFNSAAALEVAWYQITRSKPDLAKRLSPSVQIIELKEKGIYHRLYAGGFVSKETASEVCDVLKAESLNCVILQGERQIITLAEAFETK